MIGLILTIVLIGVIVWAVNTYIPMPQGFKTLVYVVGIVLAIILALHGFGVALPLLH